MLRICVLSKPILSPIVNSVGLFYVYDLAGMLTMCELSNEQVFSNWQECNRENRQQGAAYWYDFMSKRAKRGYKGAQAIVDKMDRLK